MRMLAVSLFGALGLALSVGTANAAPTIPPVGTPQAPDIVQVAGGCGWGLHRFRGYCVPNHRYPRYGYYHRYRRHYGYRGPYPYYGGGYEPWNRPSPSDHVANQLNAQQLYRGYPGY